MGITGNDRAWKEELTAGEIFFCLFFGTLLFAKGVGLYDGQGIFRIFLLIASAFWGLKMLTTEWEIRELLTAVILLLLGWMASLIRGKGSPCFHDGNYRDERGICAEGISDRACDLDRMLCHHGIACSDRQN